MIGLSPSTPLIKMEEHIEQTGSAVNSSTGSSNELWKTAKEK